MDRESSVSKEKHCLKPLELHDLPLGVLAFLAWINDDKSRCGKADAKLETESYMMV